jgi:hypothetical protein
LEQVYSYETCSQLLSETAQLLREDHASRWYFLLLNRVFAYIIDNPDLHEADITEPILQTIRSHAINGLDAIERGDLDLMITAANGISNAFGVLP